jgi:poly(3-hydroxybutyrate) depolymerase
VAAEFYLETVKTIFMDHDLACGRMQWEGRRVELGAIETALMTVEAENDELCPPGQTQAAQDLCTGTRFEQEIYPEIRRFVADTERLLPPALSTGGIA